MDRRQFLRCAFGATAMVGLGPVAKLIPEPRVASQAQIDSLVSRVLRELPVVDVHMMGAAPGSADWTTVRARVEAAHRQTVEAAGRFVEWHLKAMREHDVSRETGAV